MMFTPVAGHHASCACGGAEQLSEQIQSRKEGIGGGRLSSLWC